MYLARLLKWIKRIKKGTSPLANPFLSQLASPLAPNAGSTSLDASFASIDAGSLAPMGDPEPRLVGVRATVGVPGSSAAAGNPRRSAPPGASWWGRARIPPPLLLLCSPAAATAPCATVDGEGGSFATGGRGAALGGRARLPPTGSGREGRRATLQRQI